MLELFPAERETASTVILSPTQQKAANELLRAMERGDCAMLLDDGSDGKTTVLGHVHKQLGGARIGMREFLSQLAAHDPMAIEEAFIELMDRELARHDLVIVDDLHLVLQVVENYDYPRSHLFDAVLTTVLDDARAARKKLLFASSPKPQPLENRAFLVNINDFTAEDFVSICGAYMDGDAMSRLDFAEIFRFAPSLNAHQLR